MRQEIKDIIEGLIMRVRRSFSKEFKKEVIESIVSGQATAVELAREHSISPMTVSKWKKDYRSGKFFENTNESTTRLEIRVRELEKLVGELTMENRLLKKFRDFATKEKKRGLINCYIKKLGQEGVQASGNMPLNLLLQVKKG